MSLTLSKWGVCASGFWIGLAVSACSSLSPPARCEHRGTVVLEGSDYETLDVQFTRDFVYALQGRYDKEGIAAAAITRYSVDTLEPERVQLDLHSYPPSSVPAVPAIVAGDGGLYWVQAYVGTGDQKDGFQEWYWSDGDEPKRLGSQAWFPGQFSAGWKGIHFWNESLFAIRLRQSLQESRTELLRRTDHGQWTTFWEEPAQDWMILARAGDELRAVAVNRTGLRVLRFGQDGSLLSQGPATQEDVEIWPRKLVAADGHLYALMDGEDNPHTKPEGRPASGALLEFDPAGNATKVKRWVRRYARLAASSENVFLAIEDDDWNAHPESGELLVQRERGGEFAFMREIGVPTALEADDWRLAVAHWQADEPHRRLELTFLRTGDAIPGCD